MRRPNEVATPAGLGNRADWLRGLLDDPPALRKYLREAREANADLRDEDAVLFRYWCSVEKVHDDIDTASFLDGWDEEEYGGGPPLMFPRAGIPREHLENLRNVVRRLRAGACKAFDGRPELERVYRRIMGSVQGEPSEWGLHWTEPEWLAFLYKSGIRAIDTTLFGMAIGRWPEAMFTAMQATNIERAMIDVDGRKDAALLVRLKPFIKNARQKGTYGPVKSLVQRALKHLGDHNPKKATGLEVWNACKRINRNRKIHFSDPGGQPDHVFVSGIGATPWKRFGQIISELRSAAHPRS